ncbi:TSC22 domain family protein 3 isoform X2 [Prinia subflava]|uniref:TSC22 domain family protein 3 isoform X2 n=1 Tax=Prinia subflava TaxID=208062 RepID=UPI002FE3006D
MSSSPAEECRSPVGLDCCSCCLDLANRSGLEEGAEGENNNPGSPTVSSFRQLREQLVQQNLNTDKLSSIMRQDSLEPVVRDPCYLFNQGICNRNIDQTLLSILLLFHSPGSILNAHGSSFSPASPSQSRGLTVRDLQAAPPNANPVHPFSQPPSRCVCPPHRTPILGAQENRNKMLRRVGYGRLY